MMKADPRIPQPRPERVTPATVLWLVILIVLAVKNPWRPLLRLLCNTVDPPSKPEMECAAPARSGRSTSVRPRDSPT